MYSGRLSCSPAALCCNIDKKHSASSIYAMTHAESLMNIHEIENMSGVRLQACPCWRLSPSRLRGSRRQGAPLQTPLRVASGGEPSVLLQCG